MLFGVSSDPCVANVYPHAKFDVNIFIGDRDTAKNPNPRWRPKVIFQASVSVVCQKIWCTPVKKWPRYTCLCISKMAVVRHLGLVIPRFGPSTASRWWAVSYLPMARWSDPLWSRHYDFDCHKLAHFLGFYLKTD